MIMLKHCATVILPFTFTPFNRCLYLGLLLASLNYSGSKTGRTKFFPNLSEGLKPQPSWSSSNARPFLLLSVNCRCTWFPDTFFLPLDRECSSVSLIKVMQSLVLAGSSCYGSRCLHVYLPNMCAWPMHSDRIRGWYYPRIIKHRQIHPFHLTVW